MLTTNCIFFKNFMKIPQISFGNDKKLRNSSYLSSDFYQKNENHNFSISKNNFDRFERNNDYSRSPRFSALTPCLPLR